jgi:hypothetical protein
MKIPLKSHENPIEILGCGGPDPEGDGAMWPLCIGKKVTDPRKHGDFI